MKRVVVGITGASGSIYAQRLLRCLNATNEVSHIDLIISQAAARVIHEELDIQCAGSQRKILSTLLSEESDKITLHPISDVGASIASGSYRADSMIVVPCSMDSLASIACGCARNLIHRAADVTLKERRPLILVPRETPLNAIHLENMLKLARLGVAIIPAMPSFYHLPKSVEDLIDHFIFRLLDHLGISHNQSTRWKGSNSSIA